ncbi:MAG: hypothetical protein Q9159_003714 [Coniocarpon cinnabarinum]
MALWNLSLTRPAAPLLSRKLRMQEHATPSPKWLRSPNAPLNPASPPRPLGIDRACLTRPLRRLRRALDARSSPIALVTGGNGKEVGLIATSQTGMLRRESGAGSELGPPPRFLSTGWAPRWQDEPAPSKLTASMTADRRPGAQ